MRLSYIVGLGTLFVLQLLLLLDLLPFYLDALRIGLFWILAFVLLLKLSPSQLLLGKKHFWWDIAVISCFFLISFSSISQTLEVNRNVLLDNPFDSLTFLPVDSAELEIPIAQTDFEGGALLETASFARAFGAQDTFFSSPQHFDLASPTRTSSFALVPIGFAGILLQFYNTLIVLTDFFVLIGLLLLFILSLWSLAINKLVTSNSLHSIIVKFLLTVSQILLYGILLSWFSTLLLVDGATLAFIILLLIFTLPKAREIRSLVVVFAQKFRSLFTSAKTAPVGIAGLLVLHLLVDGFKLAGGFLRFLGACTLYVLILYMWHKTVRIRTEPEHSHAPHLPSWSVALASGAIVGFFLEDGFYAFGIVLAVVFVTYVLIRTEFMHRALMSVLFLCGVLFLGWYAYQFFMSQIARHLPEALLFFYTGGFALVLGLWSVIVMLVNAIFAVVGVFSFAYELVRD